MKMKNGKCGLGKGGVTNCWSTILVREVKKFGQGATGIELFCLKG